MMQEPTQWLLIVEVVYGTYSGRGEVIVPNHPDGIDMKQVEAIVKRKYQLTFLPMAYFKVTIVHQQPIY